MMDCFDFSAQNTRTSLSSTSRVNFTPGGKSRQSENPLGNLSSLVELFAKVLSIAYTIDKVSLKVPFTRNLETFCLKQILTRIDFM